MTSFHLITTDKKLYLDLLLLADEQEDMLDRYLGQGDMWILDDNGVKAVCVVTTESDGILEIKNLAVDPAHHRKGYGRAMIEFIAAHYSSFTVMRVGTGESPLTLPFYRSCGFKVTGRIANFFTDNYNHPIIEGGVCLRDIIILERQLPR